MKQGHSLWAEYNDTIRGNRHINGVIRADLILATMSTAENEMRIRVATN